VRTLGSVKTSPTVEMKLAKRDGQPCLCVQTRAALEFDLKLDIPVKVLKVSGNEDLYTPPNVPSPQVQLELPQTGSLRKVTDRLKDIDAKVHITAEMSGSLTLRSEKEDAVIRTFYQDLTPRFDGLPDPDQAASNKATVKVESKRLAAIFKGLGFPHDVIVCCLIKRHSLCLHVILRPPECGAMTYFLPVVYSDDDRSDEEDEPAGGGGPGGGPGSPDGGGGGAGPAQPPSEDWAMEDD